MKDGQIGQKLWLSWLVRWLKLVQSQAEPHLSRLPNCSWAWLKLSLAPWLSRAELSPGNTNLTLIERLNLRLRTTAMSVLFETSLGDIVIDLEVDSCPKTCENFLKLCKVYYYNLNSFFNGKLVSRMSYSGY